MEKAPLSFVPEMEGSYLLCEPHELHEVDGTQRSDEPVSKSITNFWSSVPMVISPVQRVSFSWSVRSTPSRLACVGIVAMGLIEAPLLNALTPTFFSRLIRFWRCLLVGAGNDEQHEARRGTV